MSAGIRAGIEALIQDGRRRYASVPVGDPRVTVSTGSAAGGSAPNRPGTGQGVVGLSEGRDFFISYTAVNQPWAEWIAVTLERAGYTTLLQAWDFAPGSDFVHEMQQATSSAARTIAVLSPAYFGSRFGEAEWRAAFAKDPTGERGPAGPGAGAAVRTAGAAGQPGLHRPGRPGRDHRPAAAAGRRSSRAIDPTAHRSPAHRAPGPRWAVALAGGRGFPGWARR